MAKKRLRSRQALILPLALLVVVLLEEIVIYKARQAIGDVYLRTAIVVVLFGVGFVIAADVLAPRLRRLFVKIRKGSRREAGAVGIWAFYALAYGAVYYAYLVLERSGPAALLPPSWR